MTILKQNQYILDNQLESNSFDTLIENCIFISNTALKIDIFQGKLIPKRKFNGSIQFSHLCFYFDDLSKDENKLNQISISEKLNLFSEDFSIDIMRTMYSYHIVSNNYIEIHLLDDSKVLVNF